MSTTVPELTALSAPAVADEVLVYDVSEAGTVKLKRMRVDALFANVPSEIVVPDLTIDDATPILTFKDSDGGAGQKVWYAFANLDEFTISPRTDAGAQQAAGLVLNRDGTISMNGNTVWTAADFDPASKSDVGHTHNLATTSVDGFMASADKSKLNGIAAVTNRADFCDPGSTSYITPQRLYSGLGVSQGTNVSGSRTLNLQQHRCWFYEINGDLTIDLSNMADGQFGYIFLQQDATGNHVISWSSKFMFPGGDGAIAADPWAVTVVSYFVANASTNFVPCSILRGVI